MADDDNFEDDYIRLAKSSSTTDRILYLFGGTKFFALMISIVAVMSAGMSAYVSFRQAADREHTTEAAAKGRQIVYQINLDAISIRDDANSMHNLLQTMFDLYKKPQPLSVDDSVTLKSTQNELDRLNLDIYNTSLRVITKSGDASEIFPFRYGMSFSLAGSAYAESSSSATPTPTLNGGSFMTIESLRPVIMLMIIIIITAFFSVCIWLFCTTKDPDRLKFADNMIRTIIGFYIGIVTGLLGLPTSR